MLFNIQNNILSAVDNRQRNNALYMSDFTILQLRSSDDRPMIKKMTKIYVINTLSVYINQCDPKMGWPKDKHSSK